MVSIRRRRRFPSRSAIVAILLVLTLGLAGLMAYQAWDATRSHERIAKAALHDHALSAAWELTSAIRRELYTALLGPGLEAAAKVGGAYPDAPFGDLPLLEKVLEDFGWRFGEGGFDFAFRLDLRRGKLEIRADEAVDPEVTQWLKTVLKKEASLGSKAQKRIPAGIIIHGTAGNERILVYGIYPELGSGAEAAYGFQTDLTPLKVISEMVAKGTPLLPPALTSGVGTGKLLSFVVTIPSGRRSFCPFPSILRRSKPRTPWGSYTAASWAR